jgi:hypothetical protein
MTENRKQRTEVRKQKIYKNVQFGGDKNSRAGLRARQNRTIVYSGEIT